MRRHPGLNRKRMAALVLVWNAVNAANGTLMPDYLRQPSWEGATG
jgi:hypothetical protein